MAPAKLNDFAGVGVEALVDRAVKPSHDLLRDMDGENELRSVPRADDVVTPRFILGRLSNEVSQFSNDLPHNHAPSLTIRQSMVGLTLVKVKATNRLPTNTFDQQHCAGNPLPALAALTPETTAPPKLSAQAT